MVVEVQEFNRVQEWEDFSALVTTHLIEYTIPQYGDFPNDQMTTASIEDIKHNMTRYINRLGSNMRGRDDQLMDMLKMAHYACMAHTKLKEKFMLDGDKDEDI